MPEKVTAHVVGMMVCGQHAGEAHSVLRQDGENLARLVRGVDRYGFTARAISDEGDEIDHLAGDRIVVREVVSRQEMTEIEAVVAHVSSGSGDQSASLFSRRSFENTSTIGSRSPIRRCSRSTASS